ncbi:MAG: hypothetical protein ABIV13_03135, partial [Fimbriimonadales bacterium]
MRSVLLWLTIAVCYQAVANDGWWASTGSVAGFGKHESIQMVEEDISIRLLAESAEVEVTFMFKNHGTATVVTMGFPEEHAGLKDAGMLGFRSWVDGVEVVTHRQTKLEDEESRHWKAVWLKDVRFDAGQSRKVRVTYKAEYGGNTSGSRRLNYTLETGATWKGQIERCHILVDWSGWDIGPPELRFLRTASVKEQKWARTSRHRSETVLTEVRPDYDLAVDFASAFWNFRIDGVRVADEAYYRQPVNRLDPLIGAGLPGMFF